ncbi:MAG: DALR domain-containing protein, partial [Acidithiobacillales bacterium]
VRYLLLSVPYRQKLNFTFDGLRAAASAVERLDSLERRLADRAGSQAMPAQAEGVAEGFSSKVNRAREEFFAALEDDFNTAAALGILFTFVGETNKDLEAGHLSPAETAAAHQLLLRIMDDLLGLFPSKKKSHDASAGALDEAAIASRIAARQEARKRRDFAAADAVRDELAALGILLEDTPHGARWRRKP